MPTNWELCFLLQKTKRKDVIRRAPRSFENLIDRVKRFIQLDLIVFHLFSIDEGMGIIQTLTSNNAFYHKGCYDNFNDSHYKRLVKRVQKQSSEGSPYSTQNIPSVTTR